MNYLQGSLCGSIKTANSHLILFLNHFIQDIFNGVKIIIEFFKSWEISFDFLTSGSSHCGQTHFKLWYSIDKILFKLFQIGHSLFLQYF